MYNLESQNLEKNGGNHKNQKKLSKMTQNGKKGDKSGHLPKKLAKMTKIRKKNGQKLENRKNGGPPPRKNVTFTPGKNMRFFLTFCPGEIYPFEFRAKR